MRGAFATRLAGSADLYQNGNRAPYCSINFVTSHDGYTMNDLVSYKEKHNWANGEQNNDGEKDNHSDNYGVEGATDDPLIEEIRVQQIKNFFATLLLSQGVPMLVSGDEVRRTQQGNNNAYCQDNEISWFDWSLVETHESLLRFCSALIKYRRNQPTVRQIQFLSGQLQGKRKLPDVSWFGPLGTAVDWHDPGLPMICHLVAPMNNGSINGDDLLILMNPSSDPVMFAIPTIAKASVWRLLLDTGDHDGQDIFESGDGPLLDKTERALKPKSMVVYWSRGSLVD